MQAISDQQLEQTLARPGKCMYCLSMDAADCRQEATASSQPSGALDFELPFMSKFLLLAAYIAARNRATLDRRLFDPKAKAYRRKGALAQDRQVSCSCFQPVGILQTNVFICMAFFSGRCFCLCPASTCAERLAQDSSTLVGNGLWSWLLSQTGILRCRLHWYL